MPTKKERQLRTTLLKFYDNPVARVSFELFLTVFAVMFFAIFAIRPTLLTMSDLIKEIEDKTELNSQMSRKIAALSTAQTEYQKIQKKLPLLSESIPDTPEVIYSLKVIEKVAGEQSLVIENLNLEVVPEENNSIIEAVNLERDQYLLNFSISGDYPAIRKFVEELINYRRAMIVESIIFNVKERRGVKKLTANLAVQLPYFASKGKDNAK